MSEDKNMTEDQSVDFSFLQHTNEAYKYAVGYASALVTLVVAEAKLALANIILVAMLSIIAIILICSTWALTCFAAASWLIAIAGLSTWAASLCVALMNLLLLLPTTYIALSLLRSIKIEGISNN